jgi:uncharacterized protein YcfJ
MKKIAIILTTAILALQANSFTITDEVKVKSSKPIYKTITKRIPYQECWDESVPVRRSSGNYNNNYPIGTIIGGVAGGVIGHQVGRGRGKDLATVGGAIIGSIVGFNMSKSQRRDSYRTYETKQRCVTRYNENEEEKFIGYKNIGHYKGKRIIKISNRKLRYIPINIRINY